jgi:hypothetical protein
LLAIFGFGIEALPPTAALGQKRPVGLLIF